ncbi:alkaline phosphatase family protein [Altererythrobacter sp. Z27]|uniref:alkaline phosphatase family protein n=1 Tax=Altererythrobacter sp. Z27 TaxID=3461147 RepID=UPI004044882D
MRALAKSLTLALAAMLAVNAPQLGFAAEPVPAASTASAQEDRAPVTILVSIDGFHPDYLGKGMTPTLDALASHGVSAPMRPSFPTKTFPNHWTLVTGLVPDRHGITANRMEDPGRPGETFTMATVDPWWWSDAKPIWVEAEEAGVRSAAMFWPGSAVPWGGTARGWGPVQDGILPQDWQQFSMQVNNTQRVNSVLDWLRRPAEIRPRFVTLYFDTIDTSGHDSGPQSEELHAALTDIDGYVSMLVDGLAQLGQPANLVIVSDHGMAPTSSERVIALNDFLDPSLYRLVEGGAYASFEPTEGNEAALEAALLAPHEHMTCWRKGEMPARFQYGTHRRIPPYFCLPETGWTVTTSRPNGEWSGGNHGYDNASPEMLALFVANGPAFRHGVKLDAFDNTLVTPLVRELLHLPGAQQSRDVLAPLQPALMPGE